MASVSRNVTSARKHGLRKGNTVEETNVDMEAPVYDSVEDIRECELYTTIETSAATPKVERKRCKVISCKNMFRLILTATVIGTLAGVVFLYFAPGSSAIDGNWASWSPWWPCDVIWENLTQTRTRACTDPAPSNGGLDCIGSSTDIKPCLTELTDGGWSDWEQWNDCTVTCGGGIHSRSRTCINSRPSPLGKYCEGDPMEVVMCNKVTCSPNIVFKAKVVTDRSPAAGETIIFETTLVNEGNAYNTSTGIFTAPVNGTYSFSTQFCVFYHEHLDIAIMVDGAVYATAHLYDEYDYTCDTADTVALLHAQSQVWVKCNRAISENFIYENSYNINYFSGYLVHQ